jgi:carboxypeptidase C (cathepsin A)
MLGFLQEHGPYSLADGATNFTKNDYSWNKEATMIYIESPAGVGFSLCPDWTECLYNDFNTAEDNRKAVLSLISTKFPELKTNDLYISGESYAGIYVPRLVEQLDWYIGNCTITKTCEYVPNLKGFIVGNGVTDYNFDNAAAYLEMTFWYGLISTETYNGLKMYCLGETQAPQC